MSQWAPYLMCRWHNWVAFPNFLSVPAWTVCTEYMPSVYSLYCTSYHESLIACWILKNIRWQKMAAFLEASSMHIFPLLIELHCCNLDLTWSCFHLVNRHFAGLTLETLWTYTGYCSFYRNVCKWWAVWQGDPVIVMVVITRRQETPALLSPQFSENKTKQNRLLG